MRKEKITIVIKNPIDGDIDTEAENTHPGITCEGDATFCSIGVKTKRDGHEYARFIIFPKSKVVEIIKQLSLIISNKTL